MDLPRIVCLLQEYNKQKAEHTKNAGYAAAMKEVQKYRRDNNIPCPPNKDKVEFYGIWPFSESVD